jgi:hypothetical protein
MGTGPRYACHLLRYRPLPYVVYSITDRSLVASEGAGDVLNQGKII